MHSFHNTEANSIPKNNSLKKNPHRTPYFAVNAVAGGNYKTVTHRRLKDNIKTEKHARGKMERFLVRSKPPTTSAETADNPPPKEKRKKTVSRQYHESYLSYGTAGERQIFPTNRRIY